ncbi:hypothetical protein B0H67DRAFT_579715 [Lasiosphaeris hirsuta]|uniref:Uncharacterized protein n=1 Tax=Lasiosphaeris hirsuta TaxID=260670 RepID=A0AA40AFS4_9PEZI|nr:hypothetical protein B0H67DRAFT_579715 [Lasiosphaeris hirsuta]
MHSLLVLLGTLADINLHKFHRLLTSVLTFGFSLHVVALDLAPIPPPLREAIRDYNPSQESRHKHHWYQSRKTFFFISSNTSGAINLNCILL